MRRVICIGRLMKLAFENEILFIFSFSLLEIAEWGIILLSKQLFFEPKGNSRAGSVFPDFPQEHRHFSY